MVTAVFYSHSSLSRIAELQDQLSNTLALHQGPWEVELKLYRANPHSFKDTSEAGSVLYTVTTNTTPGEAYVFVDGVACLFERSIQEILRSKLKSLWQERQTFACSGQSFSSDGTVVRLANVFVQNSFKGLLIQIELPDTMTESESRLALAELVARYKLGEPVCTVNAPMQVAESYLCLNTA